jgi:two-component system, cell cycle sensor histidine kinase and response regulator CckA
MRQSLRALIVEDSDQDADLLLRELRRAFDVTFERVETPEAMSAALDGGPWEIVLSDYSMPRFDAPSAFRLLRERGTDIPFIIVSGTVGEDVAVEAMRLGVHDYLLKGKLARLVPTIERELRDAAERHARRLAEQAARATEAKFRALVEGAPDAMVIIDRKGTIVLVNSQAERLFGHKRQNLLGQPVEMLIPERFRGRHPEHRASYFHEAKARAAGTGMDLYGLAADGTELPIEVSLSPLDTEEGVLVASAIRDIRERKRLEEQFRQAQKMEAVGRLAGGVAHDFNNVLSVILGYAEMIVSDLKPEEPLRADVEEIRAAALRATDLTRQLLAFSRHQVLESKVLNLNAVIAGMEKMLGRLSGADIELTLLPASGVWNVKADPGQIEQILMNLAVNARDAMPQGGKLTIETANVELDEDYAGEHRDVGAGSYVMLAVSDTGAGMDAETKARIFEPFFTTKEKGKGTGLGLATVFGIVKQSDGHIWVYSEPGKGTTFKIYLPRVSGAAEIRVSERPVASHGSETILLVEDDDAVRILARTILRRQGYVVLEAPNGGEALLVCEQHGAKIDLLLTDVVLPRMSGRQLAERLGTLRPGMKVLFMSGYTDDAILQHGILDSGVAYLQKPLTPASLSQKVREVLDRGHGR